ncbi:MAG TPA: hypothetical protein VGY66_20710 [Gemmataceae bacterium]|jgi:hypothetical protein|nr:hypothetical protein [Gemmataceae bacterium]
MAFIAECPFCHVKVQKVPDYREGTSVECPRCRYLFTLAAMISAHKPSSSPKIVIPKQASVSAATPMPVPASATAPAAMPALVSAEETDLGVVLRVLETPAPPEEVSRKAVVVRPASETYRVEAQPKSLPQPGSTRNVGAAAALLAGGAVCSAAFFSSYYPTLVAGLAALVCAAIALLGAPRKSGVAALPVAAALASVLVLGIRLIWPTLFGFETLVARDLTEGAGAIIVLPRFDAAHDKEKADDLPWVDASKGSIELGDIRVEIAAAVLRAVELTDARGKRVTGEKYLVLTLRLNNLGNPRPVGYSSWGGSEARMPILKDDHGRTYKLQTFGHDVEIPGHISRATLAPGKAIEDVLVYPAPEAGVQLLRLELPGSAFGAPGVLRFEIPLKMLAKGGK